MFLPESILRCITALENSGFEAYAVGGCVRDSLLGLTPQDYDLCTNALPEEIKRVFSQYRLILAGEKHGTVTVLYNDAPVEITTFRTEGGYQDSRHPDWVRFVRDIWEDLSRRDFTVNAMAYSPSRGYIDPFSGQADLQNRVLRAVGDPVVRFGEDALRILRGVRFSLRYALAPEQATFQAMCQCAPGMNKLAVERIFSELCKLLPLASAQDILRFAPVLLQVLPELQPMVGFDQRSIHHRYDVFAHTAYVVENSEPALALRWAALLHDTGKPATFYVDETGHGHFPDHANRSAEIADQVLLRLRSPKELRNQVVTLIALHMTPLLPDKRLLRRRISKHGEETVRQLLSLQKADFTSKGVTGETAEFGSIEALLDEIQSENSCLQLRDLAIDGNDLLCLGLAGPAIGRCLQHLLSLVLDEKLDNEKEALLAAAKNYAQ